MVFDRDLAALMHEISHEPTHFRATWRHSFEASSWIVNDLARHPLLIDEFSMVHRWLGCIGWTARGQQLPRLPIEHCDALTDTRLLMLRWSSEYNYSYPPLMGARVIKSLWLERLLNSEPFNRSSTLHPSRHRVFNVKFSTRPFHVVPFERHGAAWNMAIEGVKRWVFLSSDEHAAWKRTACGSRVDSPFDEHCRLVCNIRNMHFQDQYAGEFLWIPRGWWHSTCQVSLQHQSIFALIRRIKSVPAQVVESMRLYLEYQDWSSSW